MSSEEKTRLQFDFSPSVVDEIDAIKASIGCSSRGEVIRQALVYFKLIHDKSIDGASFFLEQNGDRTFIPPLFLGMRQIMSKQAGSNGNGSGRSSKSRNRH